MKMNDVILYVEDGWTPAEIIDRISGRKTIKEHAFILHDQDLDEEGNLKKAHYHVFLNYGSASAKPKDVAAWFGVKENAVEKVHSNKYRTLRYYLHLDEPDKHQYSIEDITASFDIKEYFQKEDLKVGKSDLIKKCADGTITKQNFQEYIDPETYVKYSNAIESAWDYYDKVKEIKSKNRRACEIIWLFGETEVGKTTFAVMFARERNLSYCITAGGKDPFSNYKGEDVLIIDDLRPEAPFTFSELLKIFDPNYLTPVQSRYKNKIIYASYIFVTNPYSPDRFCKLLPDTPADDKPAQLYRRFSHVWQLTKEKIGIYAYDSETRVYKCVDVTDNPVFHKVKELEADVSRPVSARIILNEILDEIPKPVSQSPIPGFTLVDDDEIDF